MSLAAGTHLGSYTVVGLLGAGGMGEVYRARAGKLNRDVALKVLPAELARDPDRLAPLQARGAGPRRSQSSPHRGDSRLRGLGRAALDELAMLPSRVFWRALTRRNRRSAVHLDPSSVNGARAWLYSRLTGLRDDA
jgi:serine/threonine protein kinase